MTIMTTGLVLGRLRQKRRGLYLTAKKDSPPWTSVIMRKTVDTSAKDRGNLKEKIHEGPFVGQALLWVTPSMVHLNFQSDMATIMD